MSNPGDSAALAELAAYLRGLKARSNQSYKALAARSGAGSSTLHRYCSGDQFPADFRVLRSFASICGANADELSCLHRLWATANAARGLELESVTVARSGAALGSQPGGAAAPDRPGVEPEPHPARQTDPEPPSPGAELGEHRVGQGSRRSKRLAVVAGLAIAVLVAVGAVAWSAYGQGLASLRQSGNDPTNGELLFSKACEAPVSMGEHDQCVEEVQRLLKKAGTTISVDADFGPETLRRVTAFQVLAGLTPRSVVDDQTKKALYAGKVSLRTWSPAQVERRIRQVFADEPDRAVAIAKCQSQLDPLYVLPNVDTSRNWGVFQISDRRLRELGGTPRRALDPAWNIWAARQLSRAHHGFGDWPHCDAAYLAARSGSS